MSTPRPTQKTTATAEAPELIVANTAIKLIIPAAEAQAAYKKTLTKLAPQVKTAGFRKGKVPTHIAEETIGPINIIDRVLQDLVPDLYIKEIKAQNKQPLTNPDIKPVKLNLNEDWELVAEIAERPTFKLGDIKKIVKDSKKEAVSEIKKEENTVHEHAHDEKAGEQKAVTGAAKQSLASAGTAHEGKHTHTLTDKQKEDLTLSIIFKNLVQTIRPQIQELMLREKVRAELQRLEQDLKQINSTLDDYLKRQGKTFDQYSGELAVMHLGQIQLEFILQDIIAQEKLTATDDEISVKIKEITAKLDKKALAEFDEKKYHPYFVTVIERDKVIDFLLKL